MNVKKFLVLIIVFTMLFTLDVFAVDIPSSVYTKYMSVLNSFLGNDYATVTIHYSPDSQKIFTILYSTDEIYKQIGNDFLSSIDVLRSIQTNDNGLTWSQPTVYNGNSFNVSLYPFLFSSRNICYYGTSNVFFSGPKVLAVEMKKNQGGILEGVRPLFPALGILAVGLVAFYKGWNFLKTQLLGA